MWTEVSAPTRTRMAGYTLLEVTMALALMGLVLGTIAAIYPALTEASVETRLFMMSQIENDKARMELIEDLQTTDTTRSDVGGVPYFQIVDHGGGTANSIIFRKAEGFNIVAEEDLVSTGFGTSIQYWVDSEGQLLRTQDGQDKVIATNVKEIYFSQSLEGAITMHITTVYRKEGEQHEVDSELQIVPRNVLKM